MIKESHSFAMPNLSTHFYLFLLILNINDSELLALLWARSLSSIILVLLLPWSVPLLLLTLDLLARPWTLWRESPRTLPITTSFLLKVSRSLIGLFSSLTKRSLFPLTSLFSRLLDPFMTEDTIVTLVTPALGKKSTRHPYHYKILKFKMIRQKKLENVIPGYTGFIPKNKVNV